MSADKNLADLGLTLPPPPQPIGNYVPFRLAGDLLFLSGVGPRRADETMITGKIGAELSLQDGYEAAKLCGLNLLVNMIAACPLMRSIHAGVDPLYGTWTIRMPVVLEKSSPERCVRLPMPADA